MTAVSGKLLPVGLRHVQFFELDASGYPAATSTTPYEGFELVGPKAFELNLPDSQVITHTGTDGVLDVDFLPPKEAPGGSLRVARNDLAVYALLSNTSVVTVGEAKIAGIATSKQGFENEFGFLMYQQAKDETGARVWRAFVMPKARVNPKPSGMTEAASEHVFQFLPSKVAKYLWGLAFATATEGYSKAFIQEVHTKYQPWIVAWKGDNVATKYSFHADRPAVSTAKIAAVWVNGTADATVTKAVDGVTPTAKPGSGDMIVCLYEIANPLESV